MASKCPNELTGSNPWSDGTWHKVLSAIDKMAADLQKFVSHYLRYFNTLRLRQNGCHFTYNIFKRINGSIGSDNGLAPNRRQTIIWSNVGMFYWHICITQPQWVKFCSPQSAHWWPNTNDFGHLNVQIWLHPINILQLENCACVQSTIKPLI